jgi:hypothetical protein
MASASVKARHGGGGALAGAVVGPSPAAAGVATTSIVAHVERG